MAAAGSRARPKKGRLCEAIREVRSGRRSSAWRARGTEVASAVWRMDERMSEGVSVGWMASETGMRPRSAASVMVCVMAETARSCWAGSVR